jgi:CheY-like chemotaxis protein
MAAKLRHLRSCGPYRRVLVVDGEAETRSVLSEYLGGIGYDAHVAANGGRALDLLRTAPLPDVIVCGDWKSGPSVPEFIRRLRGDAVLGRLPVLRMTPEGPSSAAGQDGPDAAAASPLRFLQVGDKLVRLQDSRR